jgi:phage tail tape-measure protein
VRNENARWRYGLGAVGIAVLTIVLVFVIAAVRYRAGADVSAALAAITGTVGTILGGYLGLQAGSAGKSDVERAWQEAESSRRLAEERATALAAALDPDKAIYVLNTVVRAEGPGNRQEPMLRPDGVLMP